MVQGFVSRVLFFVSVIGLIVVFDPSALWAQSNKSGGFKYRFKNGNSIIYSQKDGSENYRVLFIENNKAVELRTGPLNGIAFNVLGNDRTQVPFFQETRLPGQRWESFLLSLTDDRDWVPVSFRDGTLIVDSNGNGHFVPPIPGVQWSEYWHVQDLRTNGRRLAVLVNEQPNRTLVIVSDLRSGNAVSFEFLSDRDIERFSWGNFKVSVDGGQIRFVDPSGRIFSDIQGNPVPVLELAKIVQDGTLPPPTGPKPLVTKEDAKRVRDWLEKTLIGQPELIEVATGLVMRDALFGAPEVPDVLVAMGSPATGKDTFAENFVDALHGRQGAHREHMFRLPAVPNREEIWSILGSSTGYKGSDNLMPLIRFLVEHSGGRYEIAEEKSISGKTEYVVENPEWKPGKAVPGTNAPELAVLFVNEFHDWSRDAKNIILKEALEKGRFKINNPGSGLSEIFVPIKIVIATNEGLELVTSREISGERFGKPLSYEEMMIKYRQVGNDQSTLKAALTRSNTRARITGASKEPPGISEEVLSRLRNLVLLRPLSPEVLQNILRIKLAALNKKFEKSKKAGGEAAFDLEFSENLIRTLQEYKYIAEENARPLNEKIESLLERPIVTELMSNDSRLKKGEKYTVDLTTLPDKTLQLVLTSSKGEKIGLGVAASEGDRSVGRMSETDMDRILNIGDRLDKHVFGVENVTKRVAAALIDTEEGRRGRLTEENAKMPSRAFMFLGPSSTGKTELAKAIAREYFGDESKMAVFDFNQVQSFGDLKRKITGLGDEASEFMKAYDRAEGKLVVVLDEVANAPEEVLKGLYDILREPVVRTFSDNRPRVMSNVIIIMTGNAGEEWYNAIPKDIPVPQQMAAREEIYREAMEKPGFRRRTLERRFSQAFVNRVGESNIFFFPSLKFKAMRELTQLKLLAALKRLEPTDEKWGWNIKFKDMQAYWNTIEAIERYGFVLDEQGASIDRFLKSDFELEIRKLLKANYTKIPVGSTVVIEPIPLTPEEERSSKNFEFRVALEGQDPLTLRLHKRVVPRDLPQNPVDQVVVAYHEAGHEFVRRILFGERFSSTRISIIPGVTEMNDQMVHFLGIAEYEQEVQFPLNREAVIRRIAVLAAGEIGQMVVTKAFRSDAGIQNDMERAAYIARRAILQFGLSEKWGRQTVPLDTDFNQYIQSLPEDRRALLFSEVDSMIREARILAYSVIRTNWKPWAKLGMLLAEKGELQRKDLEAFYAANQKETQPDAFRKLYNWQKARFDLWVMKMKNRFTGKKYEINEELKSPGLMPGSVADIQELIDGRRRAEISQVSVDPEVKKFVLSTGESLEGLSCSALF